MKERKEGKCDMTEDEIERQYTAQCQFSVINDCVDKNFIIRALITKKLRHNGVVVLWHSTSPQTWASELRYCANGLAQINPEILRLEEWAKFRTRSSNSPIPTIPTEQRFRNGQRKWRNI